MTTPEQWQSFLEQWSRDLIASGEFNDELSPDLIAAQWLGYTGATEEQIRTAEARLGTRFPPSYRAFLQTTNGWRMTTTFINKVWATDEIDWLVAQDPMTVEIWGEQSDEPIVSDQDYLVYGERVDQPLRAAYFRTALAISEYGDGMYLLNPQTVAADGEWEAWFFASWIPGVRRYRSFWEMMQAEYQSFMELVKGQRGEPTPSVDPKLGVAAEDVAGLLAALHDPQSQRRMMALQALGNLRDPRAFEPILSVFQDSDEDLFVREEAARTLGRLRDIRAAQPLIEALRQQPDSNKPINISSALAGMPGSEQLQDISMEDMLKQMEQMLGPAMTQHLRAALTAPAVTQGLSQHLHHAVRQGLIELGDKAVPALKAALQDPDAQVREKVAEILAYLGRTER